MPAKILRPGPDGRLSPADLQEAAAAIRSCKIVAFPTDTVYGLGCTGLVKAALRRIYEAKGRDSLKPLPIMIKSVDEAARWVEWTDGARALAKRYWPGALTLALKPTKEGRLLTFQEFPTLAVRVPDHPLALELLRAADVPLAATSANISGRPALDDGARVVAELSGVADIIIDAGKVPGGESTVVDGSGPSMRVVREGTIPREEILAAAGAGKA